MKEIIIEIAKQLLIYITPFIIFYLVKVLKEITKYDDFVKKVKERYNNFENKLIEIYGEDKAKEILDRTVYIVHHVEQKGISKIEDIYGIERHNIAKEMIKKMFPFLKDEEIDYLIKTTVEILKTTKKGV